MGPAKFEVDIVFSIGKSLVLAGKLQEGTLTVGMKGIVNGKECSIEKIEVSNKEQNTITIGTNAGLFVTNLEKGDIDRGEVVFN